MKITQEQTQQFENGYRPKIGSLSTTHVEVARYAGNIKPKRYLEIGSRAGNSASFVAMASPDTQLYLVDLPGGGYGGFHGSDHFLNIHMERFAKGRWSKIFGDSKSPASVEFIKKNGPYDMALIDGDHGYAGAKKDYENVKGCMAEKSIVMIDDINHKAHTADLMRLFNELASSDEYTFSVKRMENVGVGILFKGYTKEEAEALSNAE